MTVDDRDGMTANGAQFAATGLNHDMDAGHGRISAVQAIIRHAEPYSLAKLKYAMHINYEARWMWTGCSVMLCYTRKRVWYVDFNYTTEQWAASNMKSLCCATLNARY